MLDDLIAQITKDVEEVQYWWDRAQEDRSQSKMDSCAQQRIGLQIALGRALALRDGLPQEDPIRAMQRGIDHVHAARAKKAH